MSRLLIVGAGGHGAVVAETAALTGAWEVIDFFDDKLADSDVVGFSVLPTGQSFAENVNKYKDVVVAIGDNVRRLELLAAAMESGANLATIIHPAAQISRSATLGEACVVFAGVVVNARAIVGTGSILNTSASVDHDCDIGNGVHISPGANLAGGVRIGDRSWIGIGASVKEGVSIGQDVIVAAGAAVVSDVPDGVTVGGVPARALRSAADE